MKPDPEYLRRHYASLSDEALLEIDRNELVEAAQAIYDAELQSRDLGGIPGDGGSGYPAGVEADEDWLETATEVYSAAVLPGRHAADSIADARQCLEEAGIPCHVETVAVEAEEPRSPAATERMRLLVPAKFDLRAQSTLERDLANPQFEDEWRLMLEDAPDEELASMHPRTVFCGLFDRVERATRAYEDELARRGLGSRS